MERYVGFHARSMDEFERLANLSEVNLIEIKPDKFRKYGDQLYTYEKNKFRVNEDLASRIQQIAIETDIRVQLHLPYAQKIDINEEVGLCQAIPEHHRILLDRYSLIEELNQRYSIGKVVTVHPPSWKIRGLQVCSMIDAIEYGRELYYKLDKLIKRKNYTFKVGIENMSDPKEDTATLGYELYQLEQLLGNTEMLGLTLDTGHRQLNENQSIRAMFAKALIVNMHFHTNPGAFSPENFDDDRHEIARVGNLKGFKHHIRSIRRFKIPVVCEVSDLEKMSNSEITKYVADLRERLS